MSDVSKSGNDNQELILRLLQRIAADKASVQRWDGQSLIIPFATLIAVLVLQWENVHILIVCAVAVVGLSSFWVVNSLRTRRIKEQIYQKELDDYRKLLASPAPAPASIPRVEAVLSPRELEILTLVAEGYMNKEISRTLGISQATVRNHVSRILRKLEVHDRTAAVMVALNNHWIKPGAPLQGIGSRT
jgi:DNA-binding CsgD family transcriptional regulator